MAETQKDVFAGDKKDGVSLLHGPEERLKAMLLPCVPRGIETYHLTMLTIVWSILVILFSWLATYDRVWLWGASVMIVAQYISDLLDGAIGRQRDTGLIKWGFYMDHFLDYVFLCSILIGYSLLMPNNIKYIMFFIMAVIGAFMVNSFLHFAATNKFRIAYWGMGPTEMRIGFIIINTIIIYVNQTVYIRVLPYVLCAATFGLFFTAYNTQKRLWTLDMDNKARLSGAPTEPVDVQGLVIRHFLLSFMIASLAFVFLVMRIGAPFHRTVAAVVYGVSWLPMLSALMSRRWLRIKQHPFIKRFGAFVTAAVVLVLCAWAAVRLMPPVEDMEDLSVRWQQDVLQDAGEVLAMEQELRELLEAPPWRAWVVQTEMKQEDREAQLRWRVAFMTKQRRLAEIMDTYKGYYLIDYHQQPRLHAQVFLTGYTAMAVQKDILLQCTQTIKSDAFRAFLNESIPDLGIAQGQFDELIDEVLTPSTLLKLGFGSSYQQLLSEQIKSDQADSTCRQLAECANAHVESFHRQLQEDPVILQEVSRSVSGWIK